MPRKRKAAKSATGTTPVADTLETLKDEIPALKTAAEPPPPEPAVQGPPQPDAPRPEALTEPEPPVTFAQTVKAGRPGFAPVPQGFMNVASYPDAGVKVNKSLDRRVAAVQFAEDRLPTRAEKDVLEAVTGGDGFAYNPGSRQWERPVPEGMYPGENIIEATRLARQLADARGAERGR